MLKKTITYTDYNGNKRTEDKYFNLSRAELTDLEMTTPGGFTNMINRLVSEQDSVEIYKIFKKIILASYGERVDNGKRFKKSKKMAKRFTETEAFSELIMEFFNNPESVQEFVEGIVPKVDSDKPKA